MREIPPLHPKAKAINVAEPGLYYGNDRFALSFHRGLIDPHGVLGGVLDAEVLAVLLDRYQVQQNARMASLIQAAIDALDEEADTELEPTSAPAVAEAALAVDDQETN